MKTKYDKFLLSHAVAKRAKEIVEENNSYLEEDERINRPIHDAIKEIALDKIKIELSIDKNIDLKEDEDTLEQLYEDVKIPEDQLKAELEEDEDEEPTEEELAATEVEMKEISKEDLKLNDDEAKAIDKEGDSAADTEKEKKTEEASS